MSVLPRPSWLMEQTIRDLEEKIDKLQDKKENESKPGKEKYSHITQMLILEYLEICDPKLSNKQKANIYSPIIRRDKEKTRQLLSRINEGKNLKNLKIILFIYIRKFLACSFTIK